MTTTSPPTPSPPTSGPGPDDRSSRRRLGAVGAIVVTLLMVAVAYAAFGSQPSAQLGAGSSTAGSSNATTAFTASTLSGEKVAIPNGKPSVVFFFAASCVTCGSGAHALAENQSSIPSVSYVAVDIDPSESEAVVRNFLSDNGAESLAFTLDTDATLAVAFKVTQLSTAIVLDASGAEVDRVVHPTTSKLRTALAEAGAT
ncbi:MAG: thioredoxin-like domain-containing protein [Nocardioidaceae bacterium]